MNQRPSLVAIIVVTLAAMSFIAGCLIPQFYDWTGADQSRPSRWMWIVPLAITVSAIVFSICLRWLPIPKAWPGQSKDGRQFGLRSLFFVTTTVASACAIGLKYPQVGSTLLLFFSVLHAVRIAYVNAPLRLSTAVLFAVMYVPFCWLLFQESMGINFPEVLLLANGLPSLVPAALINRATNMSRDSLEWISTICVSVEILVAIRLIRVSPRIAIITCTFIAVLSLYGSLIMHALLRA